MPHIMNIRKNKSYCNILKNLQHYKNISPMQVCCMNWSYWALQAQLIQSFGVFGLTSSPGDSLKVQFA